MSTDIFFTSDTHFRHRLVACDIRGFETADLHDEALITAWNERVKPGDLVYHLGDFMLPPIETAAEKLLRRLHGSIQLIRGNHDRVQSERAKGWAWVGDTKYKTVCGHKVFMSHYSHRVWRSSHYGSLHVYGHSHGNLPGLGRSMDVGVDTRANLEPWHAEEVIALLSAVPIVQLDAHDIMDTR